MSQSYEIDMCHGPLFGKIIRFSIPLMLSGILQLLFNAADIIVVGRFVGSTALAAVGSTSSLINLLINLFIGFSVGANVLVARFHGAGRDDEVNQEPEFSLDEILAEFSSRRPAQPAVPVTPAGAGKDLEAREPDLPWPEPPRPDRSQGNVIHFPGKNQDRNTGEGKLCYPYHSGSRL